MVNFQVFTELERTRIHVLNTLTSLTREDSREGVQPPLPSTRSPWRWWPVVLSPPATAGRLSRRLRISPRPARPAPQSALLCQARIFRSSLCRDRRPRRASSEQGHGPEQALSPSLGAQLEEHACPGACLATRPSGLYCLPPPPARMGVGGRGALRPARLCPRPRGLPFRCPERLL